MIHVLVNVAAVVLSAIIAGVLTPSGDPLSFNLLFAAILFPAVIFYWIGVYVRYKQGKPYVDGEQSQK